MAASGQGRRRWKAAGAHGEKLPCHLSSPNPRSLSSSSNPPAAAGRLTWPAAGAATGQRQEQQRFVEVVGEGAARPGDHGQRWMCRRSRRKEGVETRKRWSSGCGGKDIPARTYLMECLMLCQGVISVHGVLDELEAGPMDGRFCS